MNNYDQEKDNKIKIPETIMNSINKIVNKLVQYIKKNITNLESLQEKLSSLDKYISETFIQKNNINILCKTPSPSNYNNYTSENNSIEKYQIVKLQRQLKQQHELFKMKELAYLERLVHLEKQFNKSEFNTKENFKEENIINNIHKRKNSFVSNELDYSIKNNINGYMSKKRINKIEIKSPSPTHKNIKKKIMLLSFSNFPKNENDKNYNTTYNCYKVAHKKTANNSINKSDVDHNKINEEIMARYRFENTYRIQSKKIKKNNEGSTLRHDFSEIKKSIEEGKKKIIQLRNSLVFNVNSKIPLK